MANSFLNTSGWGQDKFRTITWPYNPLDPDATSGSYHILQLPPGYTNIKVHPSAFKEGPTSLWFPEDSDTAMVCSTELLDLTSQWNNCAHQ